MSSLALPPERLVQTLSGAALLRQRLHMKRYEPMQNGTNSTVCSMNVVEAAHYIGVSPHTLRSWRRNGKGPKYIRIEGRILYLQSDLDAYLMEHRVDPRASLT